MSKLAGYLLINHRLHKTLFVVNEATPTDHERHPQGILSERALALLGALVAHGHFSLSLLDNLGALRNASTVVSH